MSDLREFHEAVARRLYEVAHLIGDPLIQQTVPSWELSGSLNREHWRRIGRECIRQMEWARTGRVQSLGTCSAGTITSPHFIDPLTAAPDDWRPE